MSPVEILVNSPLLHYIPFQTVEGGVSLQAVCLSLEALRVGLTYWSSGYPRNCWGLQCGQLLMACGSSLLPLQSELQRVTWSPLCSETNSGYCFTYLHSKTKSLRSLAEPHPPIRHQVLSPAIPRCYTHPGTRRHSRSRVILTHSAQAPSFCGVWPCTLSTRATQPPPCPPPMPITLPFSVF